MSFRFRALVTILAPFVLTSCTVLNPNYQGAIPADAAGATADHGVAVDDLGAAFDLREEASDLGKPTDQGPQPADLGKPADVGKPADLGKPTDLLAGPTPDAGAIQCGTQTCGAAKRCCVEQDVVIGGSTQPPPVYSCSAACAVKVTFGGGESSVASATCRSNADCAGLVGSVAGGDDEPFSRCCTAAGQSATLTMCTPPSLIGIGFPEDSCQ